MPTRALPRTLITAGRRALAAARRRPARHALAGAVVVCVGAVGTLAVTTPGGGGAVLRAAGPAPVTGAVTPATTGVTTTATGVTAAAVAAGTGPSVAPTTSAGPTTKTATGSGTTAVGPTTTTGAAAGPTAAAPTTGAPSSVPTTAAPVPSTSRPSTATSTTTRPTTTAPTTTAPLTAPPSPTTTAAANGVPSTGWKLTVYITPLDTNYPGGGTSAISGCENWCPPSDVKPLGTYANEFLATVRVQGAGKVTSGPYAGWYLQYGSADGYWVSPQPLAANGDVLVPFTSAAASAALPFGARFTISDCGRNTSGSAAVDAAACARFRAASWTVTDRFDSGGDAAKHIDLYLGVEEPGERITSSPWYQAWDAVVLSLA